MRCRSALEAMTAGSYWTSSDRKLGTVSTSPGISAAAMAWSSAATASFAIGIDAFRELDAEAGVTDRKKARPVGAARHIPAS